MAYVAMNNFSFERICDALDKLSYLVMAISVLLSVILYFILPDYLLMKFMITYYNIVITIVSIIFSLLFKKPSYCFISFDDTTLALPVNAAIGFLKRELFD